MLRRKKILLLLSVTFFSLIAISAGGLFLVYQNAKSTLPKILKVEDYEPLLVSQVFDRNNKKIGEFFRERRILVPYKKIPDKLVKAFLAAEDDQFFQHKGINPQAIFRATLANLKAGRSVQGGSTITQQVAKTLMLSPEKTITRKIKDILLAIEMEKNLSKEDILFLYLNQIYFGAGAYGVEVASQTYFNKSVNQLNVSEMAILAGLPQAPSRYSPIINPSRAKERQVYVLNRMADVGFISHEEAEKAINEPVKVYVKTEYQDEAPYFLEALRQILVQQLGEDFVLDKGIKIYASIDIEKQKAANHSVINGLKALDKREGYRGPLKSLSDTEEIKTYLTNQKNILIQDFSPERTIQRDGTFAEIDLATAKGKKNSKALKITKVDGTNLPTYISLEQTVEGIVESVDDNLGYVVVRLPETKGTIDFDTMSWARKPNTEKKSENDLIKKPSEALKVGDVILVKVISEKFNTARLQKVALTRKTSLPNFSDSLGLELDQEPLVEGSLMSFDQQSQDVLAMVGGYSFARNEYNRAIQAARQTGSSFKALVYASALEKGYNPATPLLDVPIAFRENGEEGQGDEKVWKPSNHGKDFNGEVIMRNALVKSLNLPSVKIIEDVGISWAMDYAKRLGIFSPLNNDFTLVLGSSSVTLYEMTKAFAHFGRLGKRIRPIVIHKVLDRTGKTLMQNVSLDLRFQKEVQTIEDSYEERRKTYLNLANNGKLETEENVKSQKIEPAIFFEDPDQLIRPQTAYIMTQMLKGVIEDPNGTGGRARSLGREVAAKTGSTNGYYDGWFVGYTPQIATGVWVGFDKEKSIGLGEVGGKTALPIWLEYMKAAHEGLPQMTFEKPDGIVSVRVDTETGHLASASDKKAINLAFVQGTEPTSASVKTQETTDFLKQDFSE